MAMSPYSDTATYFGFWRRGGSAWTLLPGACWRSPRLRSACSPMSAIRVSFGYGTRPPRIEVDMHSRPWLWPNLLSLDAPIVALLWQLLFVRCFHGSLGTLPAALLAVAVWLIYVADRTLDAWRGMPGTAEQPRHQFYRRHWRAVLPIWIAALGAGG